VSFGNQKKLRNILKGIHKRWFELQFDFAEANSLYFAIIFAS